MLNGPGIITAIGSGIQLVRARSTNRVQTPSIIIEATITMATATDDAAIYYTIDGSNPDATDTEYTTAITLPAETTTYKAIAIKPGMDNSIVSSAVYTVLGATTVLSDVTILTDITELADA